MPYPFDTIAGLEALTDEPEAPAQVVAAEDVFGPEEPQGVPNTVEAGAYVELFKDIRQSSGTATGAVFEMSFEQVPYPFYWFVERIYVHSNGTPTAMNALIRGSDVQDFSDGCDYTAQAVDIADESHPIFVRYGEFLKLRWGGLTAGNVQQARIQFSVRQLIQVAFPQRITVEEIMRINAVLPGLVTLGKGE